MGQVLFTWLGIADLRAASGDSEAALGPIGQAVLSRPFDRVILLSDHDSRKTDSYAKWLRGLSDASVETIKAKLSSPTNFGEIYEHVSNNLKEFRAKNKGKHDLVFHLSPGTPAMAAVWIIVAKTRFPAELIESSKEAGVRVASIPFDISADYIPDLLRRPDEELARLSQGLAPDSPEFADIIHRCVSMKRLIARARRVAPRSIPVLLMGESGTGKELFARAIHKASAFRNGPFIAVNCGAIPSELVESELFGHEKGAFTGAHAARVGYIEAASNGTLFLDEVGELPLAYQVKLLRVLQEGHVVRVGATKAQPVTFRLVTATNRNLLTEMSEGRFREDLFHRIAVAILSIPSLRERRDDLGLLTDHLLDRLNREAESQPGFEHKKLSANARNLIAKHSWPGNVRELFNVLQRAAIWSTGPRIEAADIQEAILPISGVNDNDLLGRSLGQGFDLQALMADLARHYLQRAIDESHGNKTEAALKLGLPSYQTLNNWLKRYDVK